MRNTYIRRSLHLLAWLSALMLMAHAQPGERKEKDRPSHLYRVSVDDKSGGSRVGFIDKTGKLVISFDQLPSTTLGSADFHEGRARFWLKRAKDTAGAHQAEGYIDEAGKVIIEPSFDTAQDFSDGLAYVETKGTRGFIDRQGKMVIRLNKPEVADLRVTHFHEGMAVAQTKVGKWGYIDRSGSLAIKPQYWFADDFYEGLAGVVVEGKYGFINKKGEMVIPPRFKPRQGPYLWSGIAGTRFLEGLACVQIYTEVGADRTDSELYGYINKDGAFAIADRFYAAQDFSEGLAWVIASDRKKIGWINKSGQWAITAVNGQPFSESESGLVASRSDPSFSMKFSEGLAPFFTMIYPRSYGRWGYMDHKGREVIKPRFAYIHPFDGGLAWVTDDKEYGYIDRTGHFIWRSK